LQSLFVRENFAITRKRYPYRKYEPADDIAVVLNKPVFKRLAPTWDDLSKKYVEVDTLKIAKVDCTQHKNICQESKVMVD
jgi:hypothetical protein